MWGGGAIEVYRGKARKLVPSRSKAGEDLSKVYGERER